MLLLLHVGRAPVLVDPVLILPWRVDVFTVLVVEKVGLHCLDVVW